MAEERIHCEWCQEATEEIGDCGYCRVYCANRCTYKDCDCFGTAVP